MRSTLKTTTDKKVCTKTMSRVLYRNGFHCTMSINGPYISRKNCAARLQFAKDHINKGKEFWNNVIWSDETKINLFGSRDVHKIWRKANVDNDLTNILPNVKQGDGSVILWGCISVKWVGNMQFIDGIMDRAVYFDILKKRKV